ncbi:MAG: transglutaminase domain-containing protein [Lachnospiraceae bacterium]|nr:transglutaminase domain-containing protein [Lachnospiraceae bacterium]
MEPYYYNQMTKAHQAAYRAMKCGLLSQAVSFPVPLLENRELTDIFFKLRLDCPEIFYAGGFRYRFYPDGSRAEMFPEYLFEKGKIKEHQKAMEARISKLVRPAQNMTEPEKETYIHDFICGNVRYDKLKKAYSHEIIGPLGQGVGVCEGIAKTVKILCDQLGIWCIIAISDANPEKKIKYRHAWNVIRIGKTWYHLDATFDNSLGDGKEIRYDYYNLNDERIFRDHEPVIYPVPPCGDGDHFYYKEKKLSFTRMEEVGKRALQAAKKGKPFLFHWRGGYLTRPVLEELLKVLEQAGRQKEKYARVRLNWPQAVIHVTYEPGRPAEEVTLEEANEGESASE